MSASGYLRHLPEIFRVADPDGTEPFLGNYLKVFEALLSGRADARARGIQGIEDMIELVPELLDPALTPVTDRNPPAGVALQSEFLDYLASWAALSLDQNWTLEKKREWTRRIMPLYRRRGTRDGLQDYLHTFVGDQVTVDEPNGGITLGVDNATIGVDTFISDAPAYFFRVRISYGFPPDPFEFPVWTNLLSGTRAIVNLEKPAHTWYRLDARTPGIIVAERSTIAQDTLIWDNLTL